MSIPSIGFVARKKDVYSKIRLLEVLFKYEKEKVKKLRVKEAKEQVSKLQKSVINLLLYMDKPPIPSDYTILFSADSISKIVNDKSIMFQISKAKKEEFLKKAGISESHYLVALRVLRGLGLFEIFKKGNATVIGLTKLGYVVREFVTFKKQLSFRNVLSAMIISSFPFSTKMRLVYGLYYMNGEDYPSFYRTLRAYLFEYHPISKLRYYDGIERLGLEILDEMVLTKAAQSNVYVSETEILVKLLKGYLAVFDNDILKLNELFRSVNKSLRYLHSDKFTYESAAWEALSSGPYTDLNETLKKYKLNELKPLLSKLKERFVEIEYQLQGLYELPVKY
jgi:hypothetical protein